eukprot:SAG22_NODE_12981_length_423_cov_0.632716_1_plen_34_part_01
MAAGSAVSDSPEADGRQELQPPAGGPPPAAVDQL